MKRLSTFGLPLLVAFISTIVTVPPARADAGFEVQVGVPMDTRYEYAPVYESPGLVWVPGFWVWQDGARFWIEGHWEPEQRVYYPPPRWHGHWHHEHHHEDDDDDE